jgi:site-specific recombinase XerD
MRAMNRGATGDRNRALVAVLYRAGLRIAEALALKAADVDLGAGTVRVLRGKGRKARTVGIDDGALLYVERWLARRASLGLSARGPFSKLDGSPWSAQAVRETLSYAAAKAGITKRVHPHGLRHSHAAELSEERVPVAAIQKQLGHASLAVTSRYLRSHRPGRGHRHRPRAHLEHRRPYEAPGASPDKSGRRPTPTTSSQEGAG